MFSVLTFAFVPKHYNSKVKIVSKQKVVTEKWECEPLKTYFQYLNGLNDCFKNCLDELSSTSLIGQSFLRKFWH